MPAEPRPLRVAIVDDEMPARALLREYLGAHPDVEIVAECANGFEAVKRIGETLPAVVFLDVQMPKLDGFEVLELLEPAPVVVFVTAHDDYAIRAFEVQAVDYVLKPVGRERFDEALVRARERVASGTAGKRDAPNPSPAALAAAARPPGHFVERLLVRDGVDVHVIPVDRVDYLEAQDDYVGIHADGRCRLKQQTLAEIAGGLDSARLVRIHRSYVLNVDRLARIELYAKDSRIAILKDGKRLPVSRAGHARLKELL